MGFLSSMKLHLLVWMIQYAVIVRSLSSTTLCRALASAVNMILAEAQNERTFKQTSD